MNRGLALVVYLLALAVPQNGSVQGVIRDASGAVIAKAVVTIASGSTLLSVKSDADGSYSFPPLATGEYSIRVVLPGFETVQQRLRVTAGRRLRLDFSLKLSPFARV